MLAMISICKPIRAAHNLFNMKFFRPKNDKHCPAAWDNHGALLLWLDHKQDWLLLPSIICFKYVRFLPVYTIIYLSLEVNYALCDTSNIYALCIDAFVYIPCWLESLNYNMMFMHHSFRGMVKTRCLCQSLWSFVWLFILIHENIWSDVGITWKECAKSFALIMLFLPNTYRE
jgi:hypothetical protein